jgi:hypothetical protein
MLRTATALALVTAAFAVAPASANEAGGGQMVVGGVAPAQIGLSVMPNGRVEQMGTTVDYDITRSRIGNRIVVTIVPRD